MDNNSLPNSCLSFRYLDASGDIPLEYITFLKSYYGAEQLASRLKKIRWYSFFLGFRILVAFNGDTFMGQSCAYKVVALVHGELKDFWWSVDTFVLPSYRGLGIGKKLQCKLHEDCLNFSSASYSKANGIIKKKCGANELFKYSRGYYPVSCFFSLMICAISKRISPRISFPKVRLTNFYYFFNKILSIYSLNLYDYNVLSSEDITNDMIPLLNDSLSDSDFFIYRSLDYLRWKYVENPYLKYHIIEVLRNKKRIGVVFFSDNYTGHLFHSEARLVKVLDMFVKDKSALTQKAALIFVMDFFLKKKKRIDGILSLQPHSFWPKYKTRFSVLSTLGTNQVINNPYISYSDQDMDRMY